MDINCSGGASLYDYVESGDTNYYGPGYTSYVGAFMNDKASSIGFYPY